MTWLDTLTEKALARELPTRAEVLKVLQSGDDELMDVVAAAWEDWAFAVRPPGRAELPGQHQERPVPGGLLYCWQRLGSAADVLRYTWLSRMKS